MEVIMSIAEVPLTIGKAACALGVEQWKVRRLYQRGILEEPPRVGPYRVLMPSELGQVADALFTAGLVDRRPLVPGEKIA
jgi:hypothetical protein